MAYLESFCSNLTLWRCPASSLYQRRHHPVALMTKGRWHWPPTSWRFWSSSIQFLYQYEPLQFANLPKSRVNNTIIYLLNRVYAHLGKLTSTVGIIIFSVLSISSSRLHWWRSWLWWRWMPYWCPGLWTVCLTDHSLYAYRTVCLKKRSVRLGLHRGQSCLCPFLPCTTQTLATGQSPATLTSPLMILP